MTSDGASKRINVAIAGLGNCAASFIEGLCFYRQYPDIDTGLLFPILCGYRVQNIEHLARFVEESALQAEDVISILRDHYVDVLVNLLPTGSIKATQFYAQAALEAGCAFINCIPTIVAQQIDMQEQFTQQHLPLFGDDIKRQVGTTILHRTLLHMLED